MDEAPLVDEDVSLVLFLEPSANPTDHSFPTDEPAAEASGGNSPGAAAAETPPKPSKPKPVASEGTEDDSKSLADSLREIKAQATGGADRVATNELQRWVQSLGVSRWDVYGLVLEHKQFEMADVPYLSDDTLRDAGIKAVGPRIRYETPLFSVCRGPWSTVFSPAYCARTAG